MKLKSAQRAKESNAYCPRHQYLHFFYPGGRLRLIVDEWKAGKFKLIITDSIAREYLDIINRPKFNISPDEVIATSDYLLQTAEFVTPEEQITGIISHPTDNTFLEAALAGSVDCIVTGDSHLLELKSFREIPIITAREFIRWIEGEET